MRRRQVVAGVAAVCASGPATWAQQAGKLVRVGRLSPLSDAAERPMIEGLREGLRELGWIEGRNLAFELRSAGGEIDRLPGLAADLVRRHVDVIVAGSTPGALAAKAATDTIPIVFVTTGDPVAGGLVPSLARPGANLTGITALGVELNAKRLELLKETFGGRGAIAVLAVPGSGYTDEFDSQREAMARALGVELQRIELREPGELAAAVDRIGAARPDGVMVLSDIVFFTHRQKLVDLLEARRIPAIFPDRAFVDAGGLMFYGAALPDMYRHAASFVDKILKGAKPADIPVEQPTKFELVVNLKAAKALGLDIPSTILARTDEVIE